MSTAESRIPEKTGPRIIFAREATTLEVAALAACFNDERQCFGPLPSQPFENASVVVHREGEEPISFQCYEIEIKKRPDMAKGFRPGKGPDRGTVMAYVYARDYENCMAFCERTLGLEIVGRNDGTN